MIIAVSSFGNCFFMRIYVIAAVILFSLMWTGCHSSKMKNPDGTWLVRIGNSYLTHEELMSAMPVGMRGADSVRFVEEYMRSWSEDVLLYQQAEQNLPDDKEINERVEAYRRALTVHSYEEKLVEQELGGQVTEEEVQEYYRSHSSEFMASEPYIRGIFMKVPLNALSIRTLRGWLKNATGKNLDHIEKYSISHAVGYECFLWSWHPVSDFSPRMPLGKTDTDYFQPHKNIEVTDSLFRYFLYVEEVLPAGGKLPLEYAEDEIREILINLKRAEYISRMKTDLYRQALEDNKIMYY